MIYFKEDDVTVQHHETCHEENNPREEEEEEEVEDYPGDEESEFDWDDLDSDEEDTPLPPDHHCCLCLTRSSSRLSWICFSIMCAISVAVCVAVFITVKPQTDPTMTSYNLALWFTFVAFVCCVTLATQMIVEILPWLIRNVAGIITPMKAEFVRSKLAYYNDLRSYTKLVVIGAWTWGSWAFLRRELDLPEGSMRPYYVKILEQVWEVFFLATLLLFIEKFFLQIIATTFHKKAYGDRLNKNQRALHILDKLRRPKGTKTVFKRIYNRRNKRQERNVHFDTGSPPPETMVPIPMTTATTTKKEPKKRQGFMDNVVKQLKNNQVGGEKEEEGEEDTTSTNPNNEKIMRSDSSISSISSDTSKSGLFMSGYRKLAQQSAFQDPVNQAKQLARKIYYNIMGPNPTRQHVLESDMYPYFRTIKDAREAFSLFDSDDNGDISRREMRAGCIRIYRDRQNLARSMRDMSQATGKLDILMIIIFICIWVVVTLAVFGVNVSSQLTPLWSAFIAASFIFGSSARNAFESIIFVFVTHPFDTGDRILVDTEEWVTINVGIMVSTFRNLDGSVVYVRNSVLATKYIVNCRRSGRTSERFKFQVSYHTPSSKLMQLRDHMVAWSNKYPKLYTRDACGANIIAFEKLDLLTVTFFFQHAKNWQDSAGKWMRHNNFLLELKDELHRLQIKYITPEQPVVYRYQGEVKVEAEDSGDEEGFERGLWLNTSKVQNQGATGSAAVGGTGGGGSAIGGNNDAGAAAGAAAAVAVSVSTGTI
ncbi:hypothetical protein INT47_006697 [Mucor saturninus]|uniref:EF-hand domain-containing protein n=1 Tax=Mucor saturninus TaxID=64648 RepID=A0A8H7QLA8_9FUNG|nr:hypothetical protein INT47_006697 [Mucor saturninus]